MTSEQTRATFSLQSASSDNHYSPFKFVDSVSKDELQQEDSIILVIGAVGAGKTNFITKATGRQQQDAATYDSGTTKVEAIRIRGGKGNQSIVLLDTPGFGGRELSDAAIPKMIQEWLGWQEQHKRTGYTVTGVIYCHPITDPRVPQLSIRDFYMLKSICRGTTPFVLTTTHWDHPDEHLFSQREDLLREHFWGDTPDASWDAAGRRFNNTPEAAHTIINYILGKSEHNKKPHPLQLQGTNGRRRRSTASSGQPLLSPREKHWAPGEKGIEEEAAIPQVRRFFSSLRKGVGRVSTSAFRGATWLFRGCSAGRKEP